ncbi:Clp protease N-terminal domain-containing protein [Kitasatospora sp. NPDC057015]|uniref:Clp protease N-terminal domain-containing protein n=1 Tax=Kitasatospora sp. NPDC057015 TaxID=3346001 RepID=UPI00363C2A3D
MFERFTVAARDTVVRAQEEAVELRHDRVGTEHLLLGVLRQAGDPAAGVLLAAGLDLPTARAAVVGLLGTGGDAQALAAIGVDLDAVRDAVEAAFGEGALDGPGPERERRGRGWFKGGGRVPFTGRAKKVLELSLRESLRLKSGEIAVGHIVLGLLREGEGLGARVIADHGLDFAAVREAVEARLSAPAR